MLNRNICKSIPILPIAVITLLPFLTGGNSKGHISEEILLTIVSSYPSYRLADLSLSIQNLIPLLIFQLLYGSLFYDDLNSSGIYYFIRYRSRKIWLTNKLLEIGFLAFLYFSLYYIAITLGLWLSGYQLSRSYMYILLVSLCFDFLYVVFFTVFCNLIATKLGPAYGFFASVFLQIILLLSLSLYDKTLSFVGWEALLFRINPIANRMLTWHTAINDPFSSLLIFLKEPNLTISYSIFYFIILLFVMVIVCYICINRMDISIENKEVEN